MAYDTTLHLIRKFTKPWLLGGMPVVIVPTCGNTAPGGLPAGTHSCVARAALTPGARTCPLTHTARLPLQEVVKPSSTFMERLYKFLSAMASLGYFVMVFRVFLMIFC